MPRACCALVVTLPAPSHAAAAPALCLLRSIATHLSTTHPLYPPSTHPPTQVRHTEHRQWLRLLGRRADVQLWSADPRRTALSDRFSRPYKNGSGLSAAEAWVLPILDPVVSKHLTGVELFLPRDDQGKGAFCVLQGLLQRSAAPPAAGGAAAAAAVGSLREVVVFRQPPSCQVYVVTSHGRRCLRQLAASSADGTSLAVIENRTGVPVMKARLLLSLYLFPHSSFPLFSCMVCVAALYRLMLTQSNTTTIYPRISAGGDGRGCAADGAAGRAAHLGTRAADRRRRNDRVYTGQARV